MTAVYALPNPEELAYINDARGVIPGRYPKPEAPVDFDASTWDLTAYATRLSTGKRVAVSWVITDGDGSSGTPCPPAFLDVLKAYTVHCRYTASSMQGVVSNARYLWRAIAERLEATGGAFAWRQVGEADLDRMLDLMRSTLAESSLYMGEASINKWLGALYEAKVIRMPRRKSRTKAPAAPGTMLSDGSSKRNLKVPSRAAIEALADIRRREDLSEYDRLFAELSLLCICLGIRGGEALTLLEDCLRVGPDGQARVHYFQEKGRGGAAVDQSTPVYPVFDAVVRETLDAIRELTAPARRIAQEIEQRGVRLPGFPDDEGRITAKEVAHLTGYDPTNIVKWRLQSKVQKNLGKPKKVGEVPGTLRGVYVDYRVGEVREKLAEMYQTRSRWHVVAEDGTAYPLSRALCCVPYNFGDGAKTTNLLLAEPLRLTDWQHWLGGRAGGKSVFQRLFPDPQSQAIKLTTHGFRHLHTQLLQRGKVSTEDIMRVMRRGGSHGSRQLRAYNGLTQEERVAQIAQDIKTGQVIGGVADARPMRPSKEVLLDEAELFPAKRVVAVHVTPYGACTHSFGTSPCPKHTGCLDNCGDFCVRTDDERAKSNLVQLVRRTQKGIEHAEAAVAKGTGLHAPEWLARQQATVSRAQSILTQLEAAPAGTTIRPFAGMPSKATPFATQQRE